MKKNQKLNKYSTNIQSIKIDLTWSCRLRPHNTLSQPCLLGQDWGWKGREPNGQYWKDWFYLSLNLGSIGVDSGLGAGAGATGYVY